MSHYEARLEHDLNDISDSIFRMGEAVESNLRNSLSALFSKDRTLAFNTMLCDHPVNREAEALNLKCHRFIAKHLPSAGHLRFISSSLRIIILLERIGDYAVTISKEAAHVEKGVRGQFKEDAVEFANDASNMLTSALKAYSDQDTELARKTIKKARKVGREYFLAYSNLVDPENVGLTTSDLFARLVVIRQIERVNDQAKNLCEEVIFAETGQTKNRRRFRLLFLDKKDDSATQIAVALCRKFHGDRIKAFSAGSHPENNLDDKTLTFCDSRGLDMSGLDPSLADGASNDWKKADVFICINCDIDDFQLTLPYDASAIRWGFAEGTDLTTLFRDLSDHVDDLVHLVRGPATA